MNVSLIENLDLTKMENAKIVFSFIEKILSENSEMKILIQELKDEIARLKGENGKPDIKGNKKKEDTIYSSERERKEQKTHKKGSKKKTVKIDRVVEVLLDKTGLPEGLKLHGYEQRLVQDIIIKSDNVLYLKEVWIDPLTGKTYIARHDDEPAQGEEFTSELKALVVYFYYGKTMSQQDIRNFLSDFGVSISVGTISNIITSYKTDELTEETINIITAGLKSRDWVGIDDTGLRVDGVNHFCNAIGNDLFTFYSTQLHKNMDTIKDIVLPKELRELFDVLLCDDAPQFKVELVIIALCWIHELRHFKKLTPHLKRYQKELDDILTKTWDYYQKLLKYKNDPTEKVKELLKNEFDEIFNTPVDYEELAKRMELTKKKKDRLLVVLDYPNVPLHNNDCELAARTVVKKRKVCGGLRSDEGKVAWDNHFTILATCKKQGISYIEYIKNIFSGSGNPKTLAELIVEKSNLNKPFA